MNKPNHIEAIDDESLLALRDYAAGDVDADLYNDCNAALGVESCEDGTFADCAPDEEAKTRCCAALVEILRKHTVAAGAAGKWDIASLGKRALGKRPGDSDRVAVVEMLRQHTAS